MLFRGSSPEGSTGYEPRNSICHHDGWIVRSDHRPFTRVRVGGSAQDRYAILRSESLASSLLISTLQPLCHPDRTSAATRYASSHSGKQIDRDLQTRWLIRRTKQTTIEGPFGKRNKVTPTQGPAHVVWRTIPGP